jgi:spore coat protein U-like protein
MTRITAIALLVLAVTLLPSVAEASCSISTTGVNFGAYDVFDPSPVDSTGSARYQCTGGTDSFTISLSQGSSGTFNPRSMVLGNSALNYNMYLDAARTSIWGDGTAGTSLFMVSNPSGKPVTVSIFGRIPAGQDVAVGSYSDAIVVTIQF